MIEAYLDEFRKNGIAIQITLDINKPVTVHAFDRNGDLHLIKSEFLILALEEMKRKLIK